uniref:Uncharacterized protein n=1 Tax=Leersia perrieri TaxID=77586 RepID=A0A0D9XJ05_9ORYZ
MREEVTEALIDLISANDGKLLENLERALILKKSQKQQPPTKEPSIQSSPVAQFPVDDITGPTPCRLLTPIGRADRSKEVASVMACVQVSKVKDGCEKIDLDIPATDRIDVRGDARYCAHNELASKYNKDLAHNKSTFGNLAAISQG